MNRRLACVMALCMFAFCSLTLAEEQNATLPLRIAIVSDGLINSGAGLKISLTNVTAFPIEMYDIQLPWSLRINLHLVATTKQSWKNLRSAGFVVEDPVNLKKIQLAPGQTMSGTIQLADFIDHVELRKQKEDILVFWHFVAKGVQNEPLGEYGGWTTVAAPRSVQLPSAPARKN